MAVSGLPTRCSGHAINIANLALDMIDIVQEVNTHGRKMQVRVVIAKEECQLLSFFKGGWGQLYKKKSFKTGLVLYTASFWLA